MVTVSCWHSTPSFALRVPYPFAVKNDRPTVAIRCYDLGTFVGDKPLDPLLAPGPVFDGAPGQRRLQAWFYSGGWKLDARGAKLDNPVEAQGQNDGPAEPSVGDFQQERAELEWLLHHPEMVRSANLVRFLEFICNRYFDGQQGEIREYSIAVEALGRKPVSFDSHIDPIVRVTARALRKKLAEIYSNDGKDHPIQIVLPVGNYVPRFLRTVQPEPPVESIESAEQLADRESNPSGAPKANAGKLMAGKRRVVLQAGLAVLALAGVFVAGYRVGQRAKTPSSAPTNSLDWGEPVWSDNFDGAAQEAPDPAKWTYQTGNQNGWGNHEEEIYCAPGSANPHGCNPRRPNAFLDGAGHLVLRAERTAEGNWTSARITTSGLKGFQYGRIEARMKLPVGAGLWPSFWMMGTDFAKVGWPASGSIDIVENVALTQRTNGLGPDMIRATVHGPRYYGANGLWHDYKLPDGARVNDGNFHTYGIVWSPGMIQFYVDDPANVFFVQDANDIPAGGQWVFDRPFSLFLNLAVGGDWPGAPDSMTPNPADMVVDYVRVFKIPPLPAPSIQWQPVQVKAGASVASIVTLLARQYSGRVLLTCSAEPATAACSLASSVVNFSDTLSQEDTLTLSTGSFSEKGRMLATPGQYKVTITATTISGDRSQLTVPFQVKPGS